MNDTLFSLSGRTAMVITIAVRPDSENSVSFMGVGNKIYTESVNWVTVSTASVTQLAWALGA